MMHSDEELKDGRYFPSPKEQSILTQTIDQYFMLPERSEQRSIVVQNVTAKLVEINPRWTNRAVRLWFNNNKRTCLKSSVQFDPMQIHGSDVTADRMPPKKRPARSPSVGSFITRPITPPADINIADNLAGVFTAISQQRQGPEERKSLESNLTNRLIEVSGKLWDDHIFPIEQANLITVPETMPTAVLPDAADSCRFNGFNGLTTTTTPTAANASSNNINGLNNAQQLQCEIIAKFSAIETGLLHKGVPLIVNFNTTEQCRTLNIGPETIRTNFNFQASSSLYDQLSSRFYITSGSYVYQVIEETGEFSPHVLYPGGPPMLRSSLCSMNDAIILGSRRNVCLWSRDTLRSLNNYYNTYYQPKGLKNRHIKSNPISGLTSLNGDNNNENNNENENYENDVSIIITGSNSSNEIVNKVANMERIPNFTHCFDSGLPSVTSITTISSLIAAASHNHHSIHLSNPDGRSVCSLIGHGAGVSCLAPSDEFTFISGSADLTARIWDIRQNSQICQLQRHLGPLTVVATCRDGNGSFAFTGGEDHIVRVWDLRKGMPVCEMHVGMGIPFAVDYNFQTKVLSVLTKEKDATVADGFQIVQADDSGRFIEKCMNLYVRYSLEGVV